MKHSLSGLLLAASVLFFTASLTACKDDAEPVAPKTFVLVHGAFQAAYAWDFVKARLEAEGQNVVVVELPGHGADQTPPATTSMDAYRDKVIAAINGVKGKVILVGHSMGGMVISAVAEQIPDRIEKLVYVAAFVPANGESLLSLAQQDQESLLGPALIPSADQLTLSVSNDNLVPIFCQDGSDAIKQLLISKNQPEPAIPFTNPVTLSAGAFGRVEKCYIRTTQDHAISIGRQDQMRTAAGITQVYSIDSGHCPFLSKPDEVADILLDVIR